MKKNMTLKKIHFPSEQDLLFYLQSDLRITSDQSGPVGGSSVVIPGQFNAQHGLTSGEWLSFGGPDLPGDQRYFKK